MTNFIALDRLAGEGYINKVLQDDLVLYNYTVKCVYDGHWNKHTISARGTVYNVNTGEVVAQAFPKFFNFSELPASQARNLLKRTDFSVREKMDGILGIIYFYNGKWNVNTRGSFSSEFAVKAEQDILPKYNLDNVDPDTTLLVEIIYPEARIIVDYGEEEKLVLIGAFNRVTGKEVDIDVLDCNLPRPRKFNFSSIDDIIEKQNELPAMDEGFVVRFADGYRVKFKSLEYLKVARIMKNISAKSLWKAMENTLQVPDEMLVAIPEEFRDEVDEMVLILKLRTQQVLLEIENSINIVVSELGHFENTPEHRKNLVCS